MNAIAAVRNRRDRDTAIAPIPTWIGAIAVSRSTGLRGMPPSAVCVDRRAYLPAYFTEQPYGLFSCGVTSCSAVSLPSTSAT